MARYGDTAINIWFSPSRRHFQMPTAIIVCRLANAFFIAADGRSRRENGDLVSDHERKIFSIEVGPARFAFAVTGTARFTPDNDAEDIVFNFNIEIQNAAQELAKIECADAIDYSDRLINLVNVSLKRAVENAQKAGKPVSYPSNPENYEDGSIVSVFLCGYYARWALGMVVKFFHREQRLAEPTKLTTIGVGNSAISGSKEVDNCLTLNDPRFAAFRFQLPASPSFEELAAYAKAYVAACNSDAGRAVDPILCPGIGGHVHAATVESQSGFRWIPGYEYPAR
jgi:hypothetical protein